MFERLDQRLKQAEAEIAHLREIQGYHRLQLTNHGDTLDKLIEGHKAALVNHEAAMERLGKIEILVAENTNSIKQLTRNVDQLVAAILKEHPNGQT